MLRLMLGCCANSANPRSGVQVQLPAAVTDRQEFAVTLDSYLNHSVVNQFDDSRSCVLCGQVGDRTNLEGGRLLACNPQVRLTS